VISLPEEVAWRGPEEVVLFIELTDQHAMAATQCSAVR
jgi:hypothetical protein